MKKLANFIRIQNGYAFKSSEFSNDKNGIPVIKIGNITGGNFVDLSSYQTVSNKLLGNLSNYLTKDNDILIAMTGANVGKVSRIAPNERACFINQRVGRILIHKDCEYSSDFIYYLLSSSKSYQYFSKIAYGAAQPNISGKLIEDLDFPEVSIKQGNKAAELLRKIDQKILLNTQTNQTLEQIAQGIFKHWFIDFAPVHAKANALARGETTEQAEVAAMACLSGKTAEKITALKTQDPTAYHQLQQTAAAFPSEFVETEMGEVPKGWEYRKAEDLFDIGIGKTPPRKESKWFSDYEKNNIEWISIKDMGNSGSYILNSSEYLIPEAISQFNIKKIPEDTVLLSFKLTIGRISITTKETTTNEAIAHFKTGKSYLTTEFLYCYLKDFDFDKLGSTSSIATAVNSRTIKNMDILYPSEEIQMQFLQKVKNVFRKIKSNTLENEYLTKYRDELLPRLLNGEIEL
ncbi:restriction endonuclease subunit S [Avibacterium volantium]|uniref:restriction endonuclease subunit S n=1 Tax=Avibacterium TaxID=292486 RepID=UPI0039FC2960